MRKKFIPLLNKHFGNRSIVRPKLYLKNDAKLFIKLAAIDA